jgi:hypothetical protein
MKHLFSILFIVVVFFIGNLFAQDSTQSKVQKGKTYKKQVKTATKSQTKGQHGVGFVDENGDGYNDNAPDHDGDGIPNGQDEDYDGEKARKGNPQKGFVDADGDGINDNAMDADGDGIPNGQDPDYERPKDGSGRKVRNTKGKMSKNTVKNAGTGSGIGTGSGNCDGTGPKGNSKSKGKGKK